MHGSHRGLMALDSVLPPSLKSPKTVPRQQRWARCVLPAAPAAAASPHRPHQDGHRRLEHQLLPSVVSDGAGTCGAAGGGAGGGGPSAASGPLLGGAGPAGPFIAPNGPPRGAWREGPKAGGALACLHVGVCCKHPHGARCWPPCLHPSHKRATSGQPGGSTHGVRGAGLHHGRRACCDCCHSAKVVGMARGDWGMEARGSLCPPGLLWEEDSPQHDCRSRQQQAASFT